MPVSDTKKRTKCPCRSRHRMGCEGDISLFRELDGVAEKVEEDLLEVMLRPMEYVGASAGRYGSSTEALSAELE